MTLIASDRYPWSISKADRVRYLLETLYLFVSTQTFITINQPDVYRNPLGKYVFFFFKDYRRCLKMFVITLFIFIHDDIIYFNLKFW